MDYFPGKASQYRVPFVCTEDLISHLSRSSSSPKKINWADIPQNHGWTLERIENEVANPPADHGVYQQLVAFLQFWLFFAVLRDISSMFSTGTFDYRQFVCMIDGQPYLTVQKLDVFLRQIKPVSQRNVELKAVREILRDVARVHGRLAPKWHLPSVFALSAEMLAGTIDHYTNRLVEDSGDDGRVWAYHARLVEREMARAGWCPNQLAFICERLDTANMFCLGLDERLDKPHEHAACTRLACTANNIDEDVYETKHVAPGCECEFLGPDMSKVASVLQQGLIPLLSFGGTEQLTFEVIPHKPGVPFIAISHVWAHGLGNPKSNKLPTCQLIRLRDLVLRALELPPHSLDFYEPPALQYAQSDHGGCINFWIDTISVPLAPPSLRKAAIRNMARVYREAYSVLVLDVDLQSIPSSSSFALRGIICSAWLRRLWTLQEAILALDQVISYADKLVSIRPLLAEFEGGQWTLRLGESVMENYIRRSAIEPLRTFLFCAAARRTAYLQYNVDSRVSPQREEMWTMNPLFITIVEQLRFRTSSRLEDEALCLAILLALDVGQVLAAAPSERMKVLYALKERLHRVLVFWDGPKLPIPGFRWAPASFMGANPKENVAALMGDTGKSISIGNILETGFEVQFPGFIIDDAVASMPQSFGLLIEEGDTRRYYQLVLDADAVDVSGPYAVIICPDVSSSYHDFNTNTAVLLGRCNWSAMAIDPADQPELLASQKEQWPNTTWVDKNLEETKEARRRGTIPAEYVCRAKWQEVWPQTPAGQSWVNFVARRVPEWQFWCVS